MEPLGGLYEWNFLINRQGQTHVLGHPPGRLGGLPDAEVGHDDPGAALGVSEPEDPGRAGAPGRAPDHGLADLEEVEESDCLGRRLTPKTIFNP